MHIETRGATFKELLGKSNSVTGHHQNLQLIATEVSKARNDQDSDDQAPGIMKKDFQFKTPA